MHSLAQEVSGKRDRRIDLCRGLALFIIYIDHVHPNLLAWFTLGRFAFFDAADVFVFLSGYVIGLVYIPAIRRDGVGACLVMACRRWILIYAWHLIICISTLFVLFGFALWGVRLDDPTMYTFLQRPYWTFLGLATLIHTPDLLGILPLYLVLTALTPLAVYLVNKSNYLLLACSAGCYAVFQFILFLGLISRGDIRGTPFNPLAWQFLFALGIVAANNHVRVEGRRTSWLRWITPIAATLALGFAWLHVGMGGHRFAAFFHKMLWTSNVGGLISLADKSTLGPLRIVNLLLVVILTRSMNTESRTWRSSLANCIVTCGQNSLYVFSVGVVLSYIATLALQASSENFLVMAAANVLGCAILILTGAISSQYKATASARSPTLSSPEVIARATQ